MAWDDDRWRDTYDEWKLRSPYDDLGDCEHDDFEITWEGRFVCQQCPYSRMATPAEIAADERLQLAIEAETFRQNAWWRRLWRWLLSVRGRWPRREKFPTIDDDIPF